jgi:hypothetical protein
MLEMYAENALVLRAVLAVPLAQFIHQMLQVGGQALGGTEVLLEPLAHGVANRSAGLVINRFAGVGDSAIHSGFRFIFISTRSRQTNSSARRLFPGDDGLPTFLVNVE